MIAFGDLRFAPVRSPHHRLGAGQKQRFENRVHPGLAACLSTHAKMVQPTAELPSIPANTFYERLDRALTESCFGNAMRTLCEPYYESDRSRGGRPGIDPEVYFKMQLIGFFEGLPRERGIAAQYADSLSIRKCLHYELHEVTPGHSTLTVVRQRLGPEVFDQVFKGRQANSRGVEGPNSRLAESAILAVSR